VNRRRLAESLPPDRVRKIIPLLVVQDQSLRGPLVNWWLNKYFQERISGFKLRDGLEILPLNVASIEDLETMVESADVGAFDFVYSLRYRVWREPEMLSQFHNFMLGVRGYGEHGSKRFNDYLGKVKERMFPISFLRVERWISHADARRFRRLRVAQNDKGSSVMCVPLSQPKALRHPKTPVPRLLSCFSWLAV
jgi:hypothetical protein